MAMWSGSALRTYPRTNKTGERDGLEEGMDEKEGEDGAAGEEGEEKEKKKKRKKKVTSEEQTGLQGTDKSPAHKSRGGKLTLIIICLWEVVVLPFFLLIHLLSKVVLFV